MSKQKITKETIRNVSLPLITLSILIIVGLSILLSCASNQSVKSTTDEKNKAKINYKRTPRNENTNIKTKPKMEKHKNKSSEKKDNKSDDTLQEQLSPM
jgi:hypothetical protein